MYDTLWENGFVVCKHNKSDKNGLLIDMKLCYKDEKEWEDNIGDGVINRVEIVAFNIKGEIPNECPFELEHTIN